VLATGDSCDAASGMSLAVGVVPKNLGKLIQKRRMCFGFRYHGALRGVAAGPRPGAEASYWSAEEGAQHVQSHYTARDLCTWMMWHTRSTGW